VIALLNARERDRYKATNSADKLVATNLALRLADYLVTDAGFGPDLAVPVVSVRALRTKSRTLRVKSTERQSRQFITRHETARDNISAFIPSVALTIDGVSDAPRSLRAKR
jgi:hypothetical protein